MSYTYDSLNQLVSETHSSGTAIEYAYDSRGNILSKTTTDADGAETTTNYGYTDAVWADRLTSINLPLSGEVDSAQAEDGGVVSTTIEYDAIGNPLNRQNRLACEYTRNTQPLPLPRQKTKRERRMTV